MWMASEQGSLTCRSPSIVATRPIICLRDTHVHPSHGLHLRVYTTCRYDHSDGEIFGRGTAIIESDCICSISVRILCKLQLISVRVYLPNLRLLLCNMYLTQARRVCWVDLAILLSQLAPPFIPLGDFNAKHVLGVAALTDNRETSVFYVCADFNLLLLSTGAYTQFYL
jgi:hypothetical protein